MEKCLRSTLVIPTTKHFIIFFIHCVKNMNCTVDKRRKSAVVDNGCQKNEWPIKSHGKNFLSKA